MVFELQLLPIGTILLQSTSWPPTNWRVTAMNATTLANIGPVAEC